MTEENAWAQRLLDTDNKVHLLEHRNGVSLYKVQQRMCLFYRIYYGDVATFHVWTHGKHVMTTTNYLEAVRTWEREASE